MNTLALLQMFIAPLWVIAPAVAVFALLAVLSWFIWDPDRLRASRGYAKAPWRGNYQRRRSLAAVSSDDSEDLKPAA
jgi:hypothetical protein